MASVARGDCESPFLRDVLNGLSAAKKAIPARWFYDRRGSELFEAITEVPEYYPTRAERSILKARGAQIAEICGKGRVVVEFGSGSSAKTPLLLSAITPSAYVPIDISGEFLRHSAAGLSKQFPELPILPVEADFMSPVPMPELGNAARLGFFPGSTIGNMVAPAAVDLLRSMAQTLGEQSHLLIGIDRIKSEDVLVPAYNDSWGVTAQFNLNLLHRINAELDGDIEVDRFAHVAIWNKAWSRIEMHLQALQDTVLRVAGRSFSMNAGETIHTENSIKYSSLDARVLLRAGGWNPVAEWTDSQGLFGVYLAERYEVPHAP